MPHPITRTLALICLNAAQLGLWQYDPLHRVVSGDTRFREIFNVADHKTVIDEIVKRMHPNDMGRVRAAFDAALNPADPKPLAIVEADARASAERNVVSFSEYTQRLFEIQETALQAVLKHVSGRSAADIAADPSVYEFLSQIDKQTPTSDAILLVRSDTGRVITWSRGFPAPDADVSQRDYFRALRRGYEALTSVRLSTPSHLAASTSPLAGPIQQPVSSRSRKS